MIICGIDPGVSGALCFMSEDGKPMLFDMPILKEGKHTVIDETKVREMLAPVSSVFIEKSQSMPGQGISSTFNYGVGYGIIRGICIGLQIPYTLVHPRTWKKVMMPDMPKEKEASIVRALQLFPSIQLPRKKDHGKADALLICEYGRRSMTR